MGVWIGGVWNDHFPESEKYFPEAEFCRKIPEIPQSGYRSNFRFLKLEIQSPKKIQFLRNTISTAGNSMTSSERPSPKPLLKKEASPAVLRGENSGNALEASNALHDRVWIPAVLSREIPGKALRAFQVSARKLSGIGISSGNSQSPNRTGDVA